MQCVNTDFPVFSNLIHLEIIFPMKIVPWSFVFNTLKNSPKLRFLVLDMQRIIRPSPLFGNGVNDEVFCYPDSVAECLRSQFRKCTLENYSGVQNEKQFAEYIMLNSTCLHTMEIQCQPSMNPEEKLEMLKELSICPKSSATCVVSFIWKLNDLHVLVLLWNCSSMIGFLGLRFCTHFATWIKWWLLILDFDCQSIILILGNVLATI